MIIEILRQYMEIILALLSLIFLTGVIIWSVPKKTIVEHKEVGYEAANIKRGDN